MGARRARQRAEPAPVHLLDHGGRPLLIRAWGDGPLAAAAFLAGFYACLVGAKMLLAVIAGRSGGRLRGRGYRAVMVVLGALLLLFALRLAAEGLRLLGVLPA